ncbi:MAG: excinuclease ABC subunit UvrC [bacterium]|nr:excinuclease ABC subunit UvrC [bacterium]
MFKEELKLVPHKPGSYQMIDKNGVIIYVGKAKDLNKRLHSYFRGTVTGKTALMVSEVDHFTYIVTKTETESFILEINLIKKYNPKYNILLKDDKTYPYIEYISKPYPMLKVSRYISVNKSMKKTLFGPYPNAYAARRIVNLINRLYPLKKCEGMPKDVCLFYHIHECLGYCQKNVSEEKIKTMENEILSFFKGNDKIIIDKIMEQIDFFSNNLNFEKALELKNELDYINYILDKQKVQTNDFVNKDVIASYIINNYLSIQILFIRSGKLLGSHNNIINIIENETDELSSYIYSFYLKHEQPKEVLVEENVDIKILSELLNNIKFICPLKGNKKELIKLCKENAKISLENDIDRFKNDEKRVFEANDNLRKFLNLDSLYRIDAFDNSNLFGSFSVGAMVVFKNGKPSKKDYRKYKISVEKNDDYHMMKEVIYRRYYRALIEKTELPNLIIVDGAINQINACKETLNSLNINIKVCGLKKDNNHKTKCLIDGDTLNEIDLTSNNDVFNYLTRIQDEVHNFVINYHRTIRDKGTLKSMLSNVNGLGNKRINELLKKYGSINKIKDASVEQLSKIIPENIAIELKKYLE